MTHYSLDNNLRTTTLFVLASVSIATSVGLQGLERFASYRLVAPSAMVIFGTFVFLFDRACWRFSIVRWICGMPDLNGTWEGTVSIHKSEEEIETVEACAVITQTFFRIQVVFETARTTSCSEVAGLFIENRQRPSLKYSYIFRNKTGLEVEGTRGEGFNELVYTEVDGMMILAGPYYGTNNRKGIVELHRPNGTCASGEVTAA